MVPVVTLPATGRLVGLDWGERRIGVALPDEMQVIASPLGALVRRAGKRVPFPRLDEMLRDREPVGFVVGLPITPGGTEEAAAAEARAMGEALARRTGLPVAWFDERMSTARALRLVREQGGSTAGRREDVDALAASIVLQQFLEWRRAGGGA